MGVQVMHGEDVICEGTLKAYDTERIAKEHNPYPNCQWIDKPGKELTGLQSPLCGRDSLLKCLCPIRAQLLCMSQSVVRPLLRWLTSQVTDMHIC